MKRIINIMVLLIMIISGVVLLSDSVYAYDLFGHMPKSIDKKDGKSINISLDNVIISHSYSNYAWSKVDYGEIILDNGKRYLYTCEFTDKKECVYKPNGTIKSNDINNIKKYGKKLDSSKVVSKNTANDAGENSIVYRKGEDRIILKARGDNKIDNKSSYSKKVLKILKKYKIYI